MKLSHLIVLAAKALEERGDVPVTLAIEDSKGMTHDNIEIKCLDVNTKTYGCELYGEESK